MLINLDPDSIGSCSGDVVVIYAAAVLAAATSGTTLPDEDPEYYIGDALGRPVVISIWTHFSNLEVIIRAWIKPSSLVRKDKREADEAPVVLASKRWSAIEADMHINAMMIAVGNASAPERITQAIQENTNLTPALYLAAKEPQTQI